MSKRGKRIALLSLSVKKRKPTKNTDEKSKNDAKKSTKEAAKKQNYKKDSNFKISKATQAKESMEKDREEI